MILILLLITLKRSQTLSIQQDSETKFVYKFPTGMFRLYMISPQISDMDNIQQIADAVQKSL